MGLETTIPYGLDLISCEHRWFMKRLLLVKACITLKLLLGEVLRITCAILGESVTCVVDEFDCSDHLFLLEPSLKKICRSLSYSLTRHLNGLLR